MSKLSNLFTAGIFIVFLAILFHYFCRVRKKAPVIVQQQVQIPEGYVYPITSNVNLNSQQQQVMHQNFSNMQPSFIVSQNVPYPFPYPNNIVVGPNAIPGSSHYPVNNDYGRSVGVSYSHPAMNSSQSVPIHQQAEDLPPPYHVAVGGLPYPSK